jgi:hypothetical protein
MDRSRRTPLHGSYDHRIWILWIYIWGDTSKPLFIHLPLTMYKLFSSALWMAVTLLQHILHKWLCLTDNDMCPGMYWISPLVCASECWELLQSFQGCNSKKEAFVDPCSYELYVLFCYVEQTLKLCTDFSDTSCITEVKYTFMCLIFRILERRQQYKIFWTVQ